MLYNIQFLRFVAALLVVLYHSATRLPENDSVFRFIFTTSESIGFAGVDIFFVISGFIMVHTTSAQSGLNMSFDFARRRLARIFSGYWPFFVLAVVVFAYYRAEHFADANLLKSFFLWPQSLNLVLLEISWTLSYELYFYLLFSLLMMLTKPHNRNAFIWLAFVLILVLNLYRHFVTDSFSPENLYKTGFWTQYLTAPFLLEFFGGALVATWLKKRPVGPALLWSLLGTVLFLAGGWVNELVYAGRIEQGYYVVPRVLIYGIPACMLLFGLARLENNADSTNSKKEAVPSNNLRKPGLHRAFGFKAPVRFSSLAGGSSYAIYLSHILILTVVWNSSFNQLIASWSANLTPSYGSRWAWTDIPSYAT